jgi:hypothetical protein
MIKHVVLFKLHPFENESLRLDKLDKIKAALEDLPEKIKELRSLEVGININPDETTDFALITVFDSLKDLRAYAIHPDHLKVTAIIGPVKKDRMCVDFEI